MNRTTAAIFTVLIIIAFIILSVKYEENCVQTMISTCQEYEKYVLEENVESSLTAFSNLKNQWERNEKFVVIISGRNDTDPIHAALDKIDVLLILDEANDSLGVIRELRSHLRSIIIAEKFSFENFG